MARGKKVVIEPEEVIEVKEEKPVKKESLYYPATSYTGYELTSALREMGVDSSYAHRGEIFKANGFDNYLGLGAQNQKMLDLLKEGKLLKA